MAHGESPAESSRTRPSNETLVTPAPTKQGELGWTPSDNTPAQQQTETTDLPAHHPADHSAPPTPTPNTEPIHESRPSTFKKLCFASRSLSKIHGIQSSTLVRVCLFTCTLIGTIVGWVLTVNRMRTWDESPQASNDPTLDQPPSEQRLNQMLQSSLVFVHVAFGSATLFQLVMLERAVYKLRAERYAFLHPEEMSNAAAAGAVGSNMPFAPWNRPPLPTYAAALGVRGTGDVEDNIIAAPPPPEYGNTRGSVLLLSAHLDGSISRASDRHTSRRSSRTSSWASVRAPTIDALGRPMNDWSRPVSYGEDQLRQDARRSLDLEAALSRLQMEEIEASKVVTRPENAVVKG